MLKSTILYFVTEVMIQEGKIERNGDQLIFIEDYGELLLLASQIINGNFRSFKADERRRLISLFGRILEDDNADIVTKIIQNAFKWAEDEKAGIEVGKFIGDKELASISELLRELKGYEEPDEEPQEEPEKDPEDEVDDTDLFMRADTLPPKKQKSTTEFQKKYPEWS